MAYTTKKILANRSNYGSKRDTKNIKYLAYHYTGNKGDTAENNGKYFKNNVVKASANFFVDDTTVVESVPPEYIAWAVGGAKYPNCSTTGGGNFYGKATNSNTIHIEMCGDKKGKASAKTQENALALGRELMKKYDIDEEHVIRHFDVTGKQCPAYFCYNSTNEKAWEEFKKKLTNTTTEDSKAESATKPSTTVKYYKKFSNKSLVDGLKSIGVDSSFANRKKIATANGITGYTGTASQNEKLLNLAAKGKLVKP